MFLSPQNPRRRKTVFLLSLGFGQKPTGERIPRSFHLSVLGTNREVKEGRAPFTSRFWPQTEILSPLGFGHKLKGPGRPHSFPPSNLATNRDMKEGRAFHLFLGFGHKTRGEGRSRSFHPSALAIIREVKEGRVPFPSRFWPQTER